MKPKRAYKVMKRDPLKLLILLNPDSHPEKDFLTGENLVSQKNVVFEKLTLSGVRMTSQKKAAVYEKAITSENAIC